MKLSVLITGLLLLLLANMMMVYYAPYGLSAREGFQSRIAVEESANVPMNKGNVGAEAAENTGMTMGKNTMEDAAGSANSNVPSSSAAPADPSQIRTATDAAAHYDKMMAAQRTTEGFASYFLSNAAGSKDSYSAMGPFDGVKLTTGNSVSDWRYTVPNEPLMGPAFEPGPDSLFMFKSNQCKPECCGASFSCGGGCVCTTPQQRQYLAARGGNRTAPEDSA